MAIGGYSSGGASGFGPSKLFQSLPYKNYRTAGEWFEEFIDALGNEFDVINTRFVSAEARAALLDPTSTPAASASPALATATAAPTSATVADTMLDVLCYLAGLPMPVADARLTVAQKQALAQRGWEAISRKGTRRQVLNIASVLTDGVMVGMTAPPHNFSLIVGDGAPGTADGTTSRPWVLETIRNMVSKISPAWTRLGVGFSQFRVGYSGAGESVFPVGATINQLPNEHFGGTTSASFVGGWYLSNVGGMAGSWATANTTDAQINREFATQCAQLDLSIVAASQGHTLYNFAFVNNLLSQRVELDYAYGTTGGTASLCLSITDDRGYYWNPVSQTWANAMTAAGDVAQWIPLAASSTRTRYATTVIPRKASATVGATNYIKLSVRALSDGTAASQLVYKVYRGGVYEIFDKAVDETALGERTLWLPLRDSYGAEAMQVLRADVTSGYIVEPADAKKQSVRMLTGNGDFASFPYCPALSRRAFRASSRTWTNIVSDSPAMNTWTTSNATIATNASISPIGGETSATASVVTATGTSSAPLIRFSTTGATNRKFTAGVWVKKISQDLVTTTPGGSTYVTGSYSTVRLTLRSLTGGGLSVSRDVTVMQSDGWVFLQHAAQFGSTDTGSALFEVSFATDNTSNVNGAQLAVWGAYLYDVTSVPTCANPPITTGTMYATRARLYGALDATTNLDYLTQRPAVSTLRGTLSVTIVPTFEATSNCTLFNVQATATTNRLALRVRSNALELRRWDSAGNQWAVSLPLTNSLTPPAGQAAWHRDQPLTIRAIWDGTSMQLSAGGGNAASTTVPGGWSPSDSGMGMPYIASDSSYADGYDGFITDLEVCQQGGATS